MITRLGRHRPSYATDPALHVLDVWVKCLNITKMQKRNVGNTATLLPTS